MKKTAKIHPRRKSHYNGKPITLFYLIHVTDMPAIIDGPFSNYDKLLTAAQEESHSTISTPNDQFGYLKLTLRPGKPDPPYPPKPSLKQPEIAWFDEYELDIPDQSKKAANQKPPKPRTPKNPTSTTYTKPRTSNS
jgi:hypothetical protein